MDRDLSAIPRRFLPLLAAISAVFALVGAGAREPGLVLSDAWVRAILPSLPAAGYFTLANESAAPRILVGAVSPDCGRLMLHRSIGEGGQERMAMVAQVEIPAHHSVRFAPGGYHLMCTSPSSAVRAGGSIPVTLRFEDGGTLSARFPVRGAAGK